MHGKNKKNPGPSMLGNHSWTEWHLIHPLNTMDEVRSQVMGAVWCSVYLMRMEWEHPRYSVYFCLPIKKKTKKGVIVLSGCHFIKELIGQKATLA